MKNAAIKDVLRTIWKEKKRFISIMLITTLGVTIMTGLEAGCRDLRYSADSFFDSQKLFDISVVSTLGLTQEDVEVLADLEGVEMAEGGYTEVVQTKKGDLNRTAEVKMLQVSGMNQPYLLEGSLPAQADEIVVTLNYMEETGKNLGDSLTIEEMMEEKEESEATDSKEEEYLEEEEETLNFLYTEYTITGVVVDVMDINNADGSAGFRATPNADYTFFVLPEAVDSEVFSEVYLSLGGTKELLTYSSAYEDKVAAVVSVIEGQIKEQREQARYDEVTVEAYEKIEEAEMEMNREFADIEKEFVDAEQELEDGHRKLIDGRQELEDGRQELIDKEQEMAQEIADARVEIEDGYRQLYDAQVELNIAANQLYEGNLQMASARAQLEAEEAEARAQIAAAEQTLIANWQQNAQAQAQVDSQITNISGQYGSSWPGVEWDAYIAAATQILVPMMQGQISSGSGSMTQEQQEQLFLAVSGQLAGGAEETAFLAIFTNLFLAANPQAAADPNAIQAFLTQMTTLALSKAMTNAAGQILNQAATQLAEQKAYAEGQFVAAWEEIAKGEAELKAATAKIHAGKAELEENFQKLDDALKELEEGEKEAAEEFARVRQDLLEAEQELLDGEQELLDGEQELIENRIEYEEEKAKAEDTLEEAKAEVRDLDMTKWYVQDRTALSGYVNVESDTDSIESLASVFIVVFFIIAILISLTTVTRMVEEERGLIGTYKALGFTDREIQRKYVTYALSASVAGGILGNIGGFIVLPEILFIFFRVMYLFPVYYLQYEVFSGLSSVVLFFLGIVGAALWACQAELINLPAHLMRPKAPRAGSKVFLERITPLWRRLSFLNKVTARNLFRYKKRLLMTLLGIMGCTSLLLFGFAIKDSVEELLPMQYGHVYQYDLLAAAAGDDNDKLLAYLDDSEEVAQYMNMQVESVKLKTAQGDTEKVQLMIFKDGEDISPYLTITDRNGAAVELPDEGIFLTENAAKTLGLEIGDTAFMQNLDLVQEEVRIADIVKNYLGNNIYMSETAYEKAFGEYKPNGILANLSENCTDQIAFSEDLSREDWILSSISTEDLKGGFSAAFTLINIVVYVVLVLAAGLAFVVLFTLANTNISERERELATIKVLGFFDREVHLYVNKETLILTFIGILLGMPVGTMISSTLTNILNMPSIYFAVTIYGRSYFLAAGMCLLFALVVQFLTDRTLNGIDMVEALKSVE